MSEIPVKSNSSWDAARIEDFLKSSVIPMRIAINDKSNFPRICSLWFDYHDDHIIAATHESAFITSLLKEDGRCGFEIATNTEPYQGVRGQAVATMKKQGAEDVLKQLMQKYIGTRHPDLQEWLMSRVEGEFVIQLKLKWISAWDYTSRMGAGS